MTNAKSTLTTPSRAPTAPSANLASVSLFDRTDDLRIESLRPLIPPAILMEEVSASEQGFALVSRTRRTLREIIDGSDDRLLVVVGPCSIHDPKAGVEYAERLAGLRERYRGELEVVMRVYFEKPRTTVGWKGLINDPNLDDSFAINRGLRVARQLLCDLADLGVPAATEFLDPITPQFIADLVSWGAIGARTSESQVHRELASGLSMPVGFKNGTSGDVQVAVDAIRSAANAHHFLSVTKQGIGAIVATHGNPYCHVILRGGRSGTNYDSESIDAVAERLAAHDLRQAVMVDCSHANSGKDPSRQPEVAAALAQSIAQGSRRVLGVMIESFLVHGRQNVVDGQELVYGQSITDGCLSLDETEPVLETLAEAVATRRRAN